MVTLQIEHSITSFATWKEAFDRLAQVRRTAGVITERVGRPVDDDHYVVIGLDFDSRAAAATFLTFLQTQVWTSPTSSPALDGQPTTRILELAA